MSKATKSRKGNTPELLMIIVMLSVFAVLVIAVLFAPLPEFNSKSSDTATFANEVVGFKRNIITLLIVTFSAWIGAGAAYYFGRLNLRETTRSSLAIHDKPYNEAPYFMKVRVTKLRPIDWVIQTNDELGKVIDKLRHEPARWFVPIVNDDSRLVSVLHSEAIWRYLGIANYQEVTQDIIRQKRITQVYDFAYGISQCNRMNKIHLKVSLDNSALVTLQKMLKYDVNLSIVVDQQGKPTHYTTLDDLRKIVMPLDF